MTDPTTHPMETAGRIGYAFKGVLYVLLGVLAIDTALGGGETEGQRGALAAVAESPFGSVLLTILGVGLAAYAAWRLAMAIIDPEDEGTDASGIAHRVGYIISGVSYGALALAAYTLLQGRSGSGEGAEQGAEAALSLPGGRIVLGLVAVAVVAFGGYELIRARKGSFMDKLSLDGQATQQRQTIERLGTAGLAARGVVYSIIGFALGTAALNANPDQAVGLDGALSTLRDQSYGAILLGLIGVGLAAYGLYCWVNARYRRFEGDQ